MRNAIHIIMITWRQVISYTSARDVRGWLYYIIGADVVLTGCSADTG